MAAAIVCAERMKLMLCRANAARCGLQLFITSNSRETIRLATRLRPDAATTSASRFFKHGGLKFGYLPALLELAVLSASVAVEAMRCGATLPTVFETRFDFGRMRLHGRVSNW